MRKIIMLLVLTLTMAITAPFSQAADQSEIREFQDIKGHWAEEVILDALDNGTVTGYPDGTFRPNDSVNVDEFIKMMIFSLTEVNVNSERVWSEAYINKLPYALQTDLFYTMEEFDPNNVPKTKYWADPYLNQANRMGFFTKDDYTWGEKYNVPLTREKAAFLTMNLLAWCEHDESKTLSDLALKSIVDNKNVEYKTQVSEAIIKGIMRGYPDKKFNPKGYITRAEALVIVNRITNYSLRDPYMPDLTGKYYVPVTQYNGQTKYFIFPSKEFLEVFDVMDKYKNTAPGYLEDGKIALFYYTSKEKREEEIYTMYAGIYDETTQESHILSMGLSNSGDDNEYSITYNTKNSLNGYEEIYNAYINKLFEEEAYKFNKIFMEKAEERKLTGSTKEVILEINNREVKITISGYYGISATISLKH